VPSSTFVLDASILYSAALRDLLLSLADNGLFRPIWSRFIHDEWMRNLIADHGGDSAIQAYAARTRRQMDTVFPDALIDGFEGLITGLSLPDAEDHHVLAAGIHAGASGIVTYNLRDFPASELVKFGIEAWHPDEFVESLLIADLDAALDAISEHRARLQQPRKTQSQYIDMVTNKLHMPRTGIILRTHVQRF
jgi:hypothetical protein